MMRRLGHAFGGAVVIARPQRIGGLLGTLGRLVLWLAIGVVLIRGIAGTLATERPAVRHGNRGAVVPVWPDDAARAFAVAFATAYLTQSPTEELGSYARGLEAFASPELVADMAPRLDDTDRPQVKPVQRVAVRSAAVAGAVRLDDDHALMTVAATVSGPTAARRFVTVPVARDSAGGLVVYDLPSFASAPVRAAVDTPAHEPLLGAEREAMVDVLTRFLRAYLAGDSAGLAYLVPPGSRIAAAAGRWELINVTSVGAAGPGTRDGRLVLVAVQARDVGSGATYALRYRIGLVRRDRWYVADVNGGGR